MSDQKQAAPLANADAGQSSSRSAEATSSSNGESSSSSQSQSITFCSHCHKPSTPEHTLKPCIKCQSVQYCNKECQKADFKRHKKECAKLAQEYAKTADFKMAKPAPPRKDAHLGGLQKWQFDT